jgi:hypothetical protein
VSRLVSILSQQSFCFRTHTRVPYLMVLEVVDLDVSSTPTQQQRQLQRRASRRRRRTKSAAQRVADRLTTGGKQLREFLLSKVKRDRAGSESHAHAVTSSSAVATLAVDSAFVEMMPTPRRRDAEHTAVLVSGGHSTVMESEGSSASSSDEPTRSHSDGRFLDKA